jgi:hypothetical protein
LLSLPSFAFFLLKEKHIYIYIYKIHIYITYIHVHACTTYISIQTVQCQMQGD